MGFTDLTRRISNKARKLADKARTTTTSAIRRSSVFMLDPLEEHVHDRRTAQPDPVNITETVKYSLKTQIANPYLPQSQSAPHLMNGIVQPKHTQDDISLTLSSTPRAQQKGFGSGSRMTRRSTSPAALTYDQLQVILASTPVEVSMDSESDSNSDEEHLLTPPSPINGRPNSITSVQILSRATSDALYSITHSQPQQQKATEDSKMAEEECNQSFETVDEQQRITSLRSLPDVKAACTLLKLGDQFHPTSPVAWASPSSLATVDADSSIGTIKLPSPYASRPLPYPPPSQGTSQLECGEMAYEEASLELPCTPTKPTMIHRRPSRSRHRSSSPRSPVRSRRPFNQQHPSKLDTTPHRSSPLRQDITLRSPSAESFDITPDVSLEQVFPAPASEPASSTPMLIEQALPQVSSVIDSSYHDSHTDSLDDIERLIAENELALQQRTKASLFEQALVLPDESSQELDQLTKPLTPRKPLLTRKSSLIDKGPDAQASIMDQQLTVLHDIDMSSQSLDRSQGSPAPLTPLPSRKLSHRRTPKSSPTYKGICLAKPRYEQKIFESPDSQPQAQNREKRKTSLKRKPSIDKGLMCKRQVSGEKPASRIPQALTPSRRNRSRETGLPQELSKHIIPRRTSSSDESNRRCSASGGNTATLRPLLLNKAAVHGVSGTGPGSGTALGSLNGSSRRRHGHDHGLPNIPHMPRTRVRRSEGSHYQQLLSHEHEHGHEHEHAMSNAVPPHDFVI